MNLFNYDLDWCIVFAGDLSSIMRSIGTKQAAPSQQLQQQQTASGSATSVCTNSNGSTTLKRVNLVSDKNVVIELLPRVQREVRPGAGAFKIWVQVLTNPELKEQVLFVISTVLFQRCNLLCMCV
jgi:hypothetical protein